MPYRIKIGTPGIVFEGIPAPGVYLGSRTKSAEVSETGIQKVPNASVRLDTGKFPRYTLVRNLPKVLRYPNIYDLMVWTLYFISNNGIYPAFQGSINL